MSSLDWCPGTRFTPVSMPRKVSTVVVPRKVVVSSSSVNSVVGPALPGATHQLRISTLMCTAPLNTPCAHPANSASPVFVPVTGSWSSSAQPQNPPRSSAPQTLLLLQLNETPICQTSICPSPPYPWADVLPPTRPAAASAIVAATAAHLLITRIEPLPRCCRHPKVPGGQPEHAPVDRHSPASRNVTSARSGTVTAWARRAVPGDRRGPAGYATCPAAVCRPGPPVRGRPRPGRRRPARVRAGPAGAP